jgi:TolB-like protein/DNA-binding winged helix-turn-helix (wHTH) protein/Tfp pilus assembly protein PilF
MSTLEKGFELEGLRVMPPTGEVAGPGGEVKLEPKVMAVLVLMAENAGRVMLRDDLVARIWPHAVVTDDALTRCFYELRRQLAHAGGSEGYRELIETLPKRGYRLKAAVRPADLAAMPVEPPKSTARRGWLFLAATAAGLVAVGVAAYYWKAQDRTGVPNAAPTYAVAVMPFLDMSASKDQRYLADGVTEEILNHLAQAPNLRVISRTSTFSLRNANLDIPQIGDRLSVDYVLEGSVRRSGAQLRITAQLIDVATNSHIWSQTYDRTLDDLFAMEDEIAASVARELKVELASDVWKDAAPVNADAYERYLQAQFHYHRRSEGDIQRAIDYYEESVEIAPELARAWAALAGAYSLAIGEIYGNSNPALREMQGRAARKAVELDPHLAVAQARLAQYYYHVQQHDRGDEHMRIAASLDPDDPLVLGFAATDALWKGDLSTALDLWRKAVAQDPLSPTVRGNLAYFLYLGGQLEESLAEFRRVLDLNPAAAPKLHGDIARVLILLGRNAEATTAIANVPEGSWRDSTLALMHRAPGRRIESDAALARLATAADSILDRVHLAEAYAYRGQDEKALRVLLEFRQSLDRKIGERPRDWWYFQDELRMAALLKPLHDDPRWATLTAIPADR